MALLASTCSGAARRLLQSTARAAAVAVKTSVRPASLDGPPVESMDDKFNLEKDGVVVSVDEVSRFVRDCVTKVGASLDHGTQLAEMVAEADRRSHYSHGLIRTAMYVNELQSLACNSDGEPAVVLDKESTAWVDGRNLLGPVVGNFAMDLAIEKAKKNGAGVVACFSSNHFGIAGWYSSRAARQQLIGMALSNTSPLCFPTRSREVAIGTNALALAAPGVDGDTFELDMASTSVSMGRVELAQLRGERNMPITWAADRKGRPTTSPDEVMDGGGLLPLAGGEPTGGYKGYGLSLMVEVLCGVLAGAQWGPHVRPWHDCRQAANLGQTFIAIDPASFAPGFQNRLRVVLETMRNLKPIDEHRPVLVAGDPERAHAALCDRLGGIPYHPNQIDHAICAAHAESRRRAAGCYAHGHQAQSRRCLRD